MNRTLLSRPLVRGSAAALAGLLAITALAGCGPAGSTDTGSDEPIDWKLTETTAAPSGDIDSFTFAS